MNLIYFPIILSVVGFIKCDPATSEIDNENEDDKLISLLFTKINWIITEIEKLNTNVNNITKNINNINERLNTQTQEENVNLQLIKAEIRELNQAIKTDGMEMKQQLFQRIDRQENLMTQSSNDMEILNKTVTKILTDGIEMKQQLFEKIDLQENLMVISSKDIESFNKTINKILTDGVEMKRQLFEKIDLQENLMAKSSKDMEILNKTINKILSDGMELKQQLFEKIDEQEHLITKSSKEIDKILKIPPTNDVDDWLVILRRQDGSIDFDRNWYDYENGFGNPNGEFFIGLEKLYVLTESVEPHELLIVLKDFDNNIRYAKYDHFVVGSPAEKFKLKELGEYSGDAGDSLSQHLHSKFSTADQDNDEFSGNCAENHRGGWWFHECYDSHLTGPYFHQPTSNEKNGITWNDWRGGVYSLKFVEMRVRAKFH